MFGLSNTALGLLFMTIGMFVFAAVDAQAKLLTDSFHPIQIVWVRQLGLLLSVLVIFLIRGSHILKSKRPGLQIMRGAAAAGSGTCFIVALAFVPLTDAVAVSFVAPFIVTLLGAWILKEIVGVRRWTAVAVGFVGTLIVIRPGLGVVHPAILLVLGAAALFALRQVLSRILAACDNTYTTLAYTGLVGSLILSVPLPFVWQWPQTSQEILLLAGVAIMAAGAEFMVIRALEITQAVILAPIQYTLIIWSSFYGFFIFGQLPDHWTWLGTGLIIATGLYTVHRDHKSSQRASEGE